MKLEEWVRFCQQQRRDQSTGEFLSEKSQDLHSKADSSQHERCAAKTLEVAGSAQEAVGQRIAVRITVRKCGILQDSDNVFVKALVDQLRHCLLIPEDNPGVIKLEVDQRKVKTKAEQGTEIEVIFP